MTIQLESYSYKYKKKKEIPIFIEPDINLKNRTLKQQFGGTSKGTRGSLGSLGSVKSSSGRNTSAAKTRHALTYAVIDAKIKTMMAKKESKKKSDKRGDLTTDSESRRMTQRKSDFTKEALRKTQEIQLRQRQTAILSKTDSTASKSSRPEIRSQESSATDSRRRITDAQLKVISRKAAASVAAKQVGSLRILGKTAKEAAEFLISGQAATAKTTGAKAENMAMLQNLQVECQAIIRDAALNSLDFSNKRQLSEAEIQRVKPLLQETISRANNVLDAYQTTVLQSYISADGIKSQSAFIQAEITTLKSVIQKASARLQEISSIPTPDPVDLQPLKSALDSATRERDSFTPTPLTSPTRQHADSISTKINEAFNAMKTEIDALNTSNQGYKTQIDNASAIIKDTAKNKEEAQAEFSAALDSAKTTSLTPAQRKEYSDIVSSHELDVSNSSKLDAEINASDPVRSLLQNTKSEGNINNVNTAFIQHKNATDMLDGDTSILEVPDPIPLEYTPLSTVESTAITDKKIEIQTLESNITTVGTQKNDAAKTEKEASDTYFQAELLPSPTRDLIDAESARYEILVNNHSSAISASRKTTQGILKILLSAAKAAFGLKKSSSSTTKTTEAQRAANKKADMPDFNSNRKRDTTTTNFILRETSKQKSILTTLNEGYKAIIAVLSRGTKVQGTLINNGESIRIEMIIKDIRDVKQPEIEAAIRELNNSINNPTARNLVTPDPTAKDNAETNLETKIQEISDLEGPTILLETKSTALLEKYKGEILIVVTQRFNRKQQEMDYTAAKNMMESIVSSTRFDKNNSYSIRVTYRNFAEGGLRVPMRTNFAIRFEPNLKSRRETTKLLESRLLTAEANKTDTSNKLDLALIKKSENIDGLSMKNTMKLYILSTLNTIQNKIQSIKSYINSIVNKPKTVRELPDLTQDSIDLQNKKNALDNANREFSERTQTEIDAQTSLRENVELRLEVGALNVVGGIKPADTTILLETNSSRDAFDKASENASISRSEYTLRAQSVKDGLAGQREAAKNNAPVKVELPSKPTPPNKTMLDSIKQIISKLMGENTNLSNRKNAEGLLTKIVNKNVDRVTSTKEYVDIVSKPRDNLNSEGATANKNKNNMDAQAVKDGLKLEALDKVNKNKDTLQELMNSRDQLIKEMNDLEADNHLNMYDKEGALKAILKEIHNLDRAKNKLEDAITKLENEITRIERELQSSKLDPKYREELLNRLEKLNKLKNELKEGLNKINREIKRRQDDINALRKEIDALNKLKKEVKEDNNLGNLIPVLGLAALGLGGLLIPAFGPSVFSAPGFTPGPDTRPQADSTTSTRGDDQTAQGKKDGCNDGIKQGEIDGRVAGLAEVQRQYNQWLADNKDLTFVPTNSSNASNTPENTPENASTPSNTREISPENNSNASNAPENVPENAEE